MAKSKNILLNDLQGKVGDLVVRHENAQTIVSKRGRINTSNSPLQQESRQQMRVRGAAYSALDGETQQMWLALGLQMKPDNPKAVRQTLTAPAAYQSVNGLLYSLGSPYINVPLAAPEVPLPLPSIQVDALRTGGSGGAFTLRIVSPAYDGPVQVWATKPVLAGVNVFRKSSFKQIVVLDNLAAPSTSVVSDYVARFGVPKVGYKIGLRLVPLTPTGFKGLSVTAFGIVGTPPAGAEMGDDDNGDTSLVVG